MSKKKRSNKTKNYKKLKLREEQLEISKELIQTGNVDVHREVINEEKTIIVPITREELVIEKKTANVEASSDKNSHTEVIRIPISEERIEVVKHLVKLEDVSVYRRQFQETQHIEEILKKEKLHVETLGDVKVHDNE
ncbi:MAG TPA: YsnF/AvaK domain-containing protein [Clostridia bacterium]|nr:YsnF/AvaK domain-containing protein [Clostridia bacterium]